MISIYLIYLMFFNIKRLIFFYRPRLAPRLMNEKLHDVTKRDEVDL